MIRHVAGRIDARHVGFAVFVHDDSVADFDAAAGGEVDDRFDAGSDDREIALHPTAALREDSLDAVPSLDPGHDVVEQGLDPLLLVDGGYDLPDLLAEDAKERCR
ncbi:hypothetical protein D3C83_35390 [compost metagenome]